MHNIHSSTMTTDFLYNSASAWSPRFSPAPPLEDGANGKKNKGKSPASLTTPYVSLMMDKHSHDVWGSPRDRTITESSLNSSENNAWSMSAPELPVLDQGPPLEISILDLSDSDDDVSVLNDNPDEDDQDVLPQPTYDVLQTLFQHMDQSDDDAGSNFGGE
jgi:hypothetical protein